jgi:hypothetical protein
MRGPPGGYRRRSSSDERGRALSQSQRAPRPPPRGPAPPPPRPKSQAYYAARLKKFYEVHNPSKLDEVDQILAAFKGREELMLQKLYERYNVPYDEN